MQSNLRGARIRLLAMLVIAIVGLLLLGGTLAVSGPNHALAAPSEQQAVPPRAATLYGPTAVTTGTTYSAAPLTVQGNDFSRVTNYKTADVYVSSGANTTGTLTVTVQTSADQNLWADAAILATGFNTAGVINSAFVPYRVVLSGSGTGMVSLPVSGEFLRVKVESAGATTPTVKATYR